MKQINEYVENSLSMKQMLENESVNEGLKDVLNFVKDKFKQAFAYLKGVVARFGVYFLPVNEAGELMPAISPLTMDAAYKGGMINKSTTCIIADKQGKKITGNSASYKDALALYGSGNSLAYYRSIYEGTDDIKANVNEVRLQNSDPEAKYNVIVDDKELKDEISWHLKHKGDAKLLIYGAPGIGKTAILMNVLDEMRADFPDYRLVVKTLSNETPDNFTLPKYVEVEGQEMATDVPKTWLPVYKPTGDGKKDAALDAACGHGLLFIDELSRATPQVLNVVLPLVNEGVFNGYKLGSGWTIVCASNRAEDEMSGQSDIGNALANRFNQVYYEPTVKTWENWAKTQGYMSPLLLQWLSLPESETMSGGKFFYYDPNEDATGNDVTKLMCTPRAWTNAMRKLATFSRTGNLEGWTIFDLPERVIARVLNGYVPSSAIDSFLSFLHVIQKIGDFDRTVMDIWKNDGKSFKIDKKDLSAVSLTLAQLVCTAHAKDLPTEKEFTSVANWLVSLNSDQTASYFLDTYKNVFLSSLPENLQDSAFMLVASAKAKGWDSDELNLYRTAFRNVFQAWNTKLEEFPDWSAGLQILAKKYGGAFKSAVVGDRKDALG